MYKIVGLCGEPATGKSSLVKDIKDSISLEWNCVKFGTLRYLTCTESNLLILGEYNEGNMFPGTDTLSMSVQRDAEEFLNTLFATENYSYKVLFEGDRLFYNKFIAKIIAQATEFELIQLVATPAQLGERRLQRIAAGHMQNPEFIQGRVTKYRNLKHQYPFINVRPNDNVNQRAALFQHIIDVLGV